jgi:hypothetical protein
MNQLPPKLVHDVLLQERIERCHLCIVDIKIQMAVFEGLKNTRNFLKTELVSVDVRCSIPRE